MRLLTRVQTAVEALGKFFRECARLNQQQFQQIDAAIRGRHINREGSGCFPYPALKQAKKLGFAEDFLSFHLDLWI
jgi:hypothetical protein